MSRKMIFSIPAPCRQNWQEMTLAEKGRHCTACQKTVVDFTGMNDEQLIAFFRKRTSGSVCGRMRPDQVDRYLETPRKRIPWLRYFFQIVIPAFFLGKEAAAQGMVTVVQKNTAAQVPPPLNQIQLPSPDKPDFLTINGRVVDSGGRGIPFASIVLNGTDNRIVRMADKEGHFLTYLSKKRDANPRLEVSSIGYNTTEVQLPADSLLAKEILSMEIILETRNEFFTGLVSVAGPRKLEEYKGTESVKVISAPLTDKEARGLKAYPNPLRAGDEITIELDEVVAGTYSYQLVSYSGQQVAVGQQYLEGSQSRLRFPIPNVAPGQYLVNVVSDDGGKKSVGIVVRSKL